MSLLTGNATDGRKLIAGAGSPEGVLVANVGTFYIDNATGTIYTKTSGAGNTGWSAVGGGGGIPEQIKSQTNIDGTSTPGMWIMNSRMEFGNGLFVSLDDVFPDLTGFNYTGVINIFANALAGDTVFNVHFKQDGTIFATMYSGTKWATSDTPAKLCFIAPSGRAGIKNNAASSVDLAISLTVTGIPYPPI
jgi:hypothetical protein